jgi:hypothetical protein
MLFEFAAGERVTSILASEWMWVAENVRLDFMLPFHQGKGTKSQYMNNR